MKSKYKVCNICGANDAEKCFEKFGYSIVECKTCSFVYVGEDVSIEELNKHYGETFYKNDTEQNVYADYRATEEDRLISARSFLKKVRGFCPEGKLLDVGCAMGYFLESAKPYFKVTGVEFSEYSSDYARNRFGLDVRTGSLNDAKFQDNTFDVITLWAVIEHVIDPSEVFREIKRILKPGGYVMLTTGDVKSINARLSGRNWGLYTPPSHLTFFSKKTMVDMAKRAGLQLVDYRTTGVIYNHPTLNNSIMNRAANLLRIGDTMLVTFSK